MQNFGKTFAFFFWTSGKIILFWFQTQSFFKIKCFQPRNFVWSCKSCIFDRDCRRRNFVNDILQKVLKRGKNIITKKLFSGKLEIVHFVIFLILLEIILGKLLLPPTLSWVCRTFEFWNGFAQEFRFTSWLHYKKYNFEWKLKQSRPSRKKKERTKFLKSCLSFPLEPRRRKTFFTKVLCFFIHWLFFLLFVLMFIENFSAFYFS